MTPEFEETQYSTP